MLNSNNKLKGIQTHLMLLSFLLLAACNLTGNEDNDFNFEDSIDEGVNEQEEVEEGTENQTVEETNQESKQEGNKESVDFSHIETDDWKVETLADNLAIPWSIDMSDGVFYLPERDGSIVTLENGQLKRMQLHTSQQIAHEGEGGFLGFILAEDFSDSNEAFAYYTYADGRRALKNRIVLVELEEDRWIEKKILLDDIPGSRIHNGGRLALSPDGLLYATTGDANEPHLSQQVESLAGSILRLTTSGEIPEQNPFDDSYVYSYGHRNPQGLAWNQQGDLYSSEHGPTAQDEINLIEAGNNYGWPIIEGDQVNEGMEEPLIHSGAATWAPSGITFWNDNLFVVGLRGESLYYFDEEINEMLVVFQGEGRLRDVAYHEGALYLITNNTDGRGNPSSDDDRLLKLSLQN